MQRPLLFPRTHNPPWKTSKDNFIIAPLVPLARENCDSLHDCDPPPKVPAEAFPVGRPADCEWWPRQNGLFRSSSRTVLDPASTVSCWLPPCASIVTTTGKSCTSI